MGFGQGPFRRTKWIFFTFSGPAVSVLKRSKAASAKPHVKAALGACSVDLQVTSADELSLEHVIDKVKKIPGVEGAASHSPYPHVLQPPPISLSHSHTHTTPRFLQAKA